MHFDFYQQYKDYSNIELLKIVKQAANYQPSAVTVATQILSERQITPEEIQHVDQFFQDLDNSVNAKKEKLDVLKNKATDFFEPVLHPSEKIEPNKWVNILLLVICIQYAWALFNTIKQLIHFLQCTYCSFDITLFGELFDIAYTPLIFFLLFKRRRWGWILLFANNLFALISRASQSYIFFKYQSIHHGDTTSFLLQVMMAAAFVFFLWRDTIANHFGVTHETKKKTAIITIAGTLLFILTMYLMFGL